MARIIGLILTLLLISVAGTAHATHIMGGDIYYNCLGNNQYEVTVIIYRDCNSQVAINRTLRISSATLGQNIVPTLTQVSGPTQITPTNNSGNCNGTVAICQEQNVYKTTVTLAPAPDWIFGVQVLCCRNAGNNLSNLGAQYFEATLDNSSGACNSSPTFFGSGVHVLCLNNDYILDPGICELDGDSLAFSIIETRSAVNNNNPYSPPFNVNNPVPSTPGLSINRLTGEIAIRPTGSANYVAVFAIRIDEYRNGVKVGSVVREYQIYYIPCPTPINNPPSFGAITNLSGGIINDGKIDVCPGDTLKFDIAGSDIDLLDSLLITDSLNLPGATLTNNTGGNNVNATFCWIAPMNPQKFCLVFKIRDSGCPIYASNVKAFIVNVQGGTQILGASAKFACANGSNPAVLTAYGGSTFTWSVVSGDQNSLNGVNINDPTIMVTPSVPTTYTVTTDFDCGGNAPTVTVNPVNPPTLVAGGDTSLCGIQAVPVSALATGGSGGPFQYSWFPTANVANPNSQNTTVNPQDSTSYIVQVKDSASGCFAFDTIQVNVNAPFLSMAPTLSSNTYCPGNPPVTLTSNAQAGNCSSYRVNSIPHAPTAVNPVSGQVIALGLGSTAGPYNLGFSMDYFCQSVSSFYISSGGWLSFSNPNGNPYTGAQQLPTGVQPNNIVSFLWGDFILNPFAGNFMNYVVNGTAPNRIGLLTMTNGLSANNNSTDNTVQVKFFEASGDIEVHLTRANVGARSTIGVEGPAGSLGIAAPARNNVTFNVAAGQEEAWRFSYDKGAPYTVTWYAQPFPPNPPLGTGDSIQVTPTGPTTYCAVVTDNGSQCSDTFCYPNQVTAANLVANGPAGPLLIGSTANLTSTYTGLLTPNCTDYLVANIAYAPEPKGGTTLTMGDDDTQGPFNLGFTFDWYCNPVSQIWINSNGWVTFSNPNQNAPGPFSIPDPLGPDDMISFLATDLEPNVGGTIRYQTLGAAGNRRFVVSFDRVPYYASSNLVDVQLILFEANDYIEVHCTRVDADPNSAVTQGIQEDMANGEFAPGRNNVLLPNQVTNDAVRFRPQVNNVVYSWTSDGGNGVFQDSTQIDPTTNPLGASATGFYTFYVQADNGDCILYDTVIVPISVLAVDDLSFAVRRDQDISELTWSIPEQDNIRYFTVEHKAAGADFVPIFQQENTNIETYTYRHESPAQGLNSYRLRIHQLDGSIRYSQIEELFFDTESTVSILPNPGKNDFVLHFQSRTAANGELQLLDTQGKLVHREYISVEEAGSHAHALDLSGLAPGVYVYKMAWEGTLVVGKLVVQ